MSFPINTSATATVIPALPYSITSTFGGVAFGETWFTYTAVQQDILIGVHLTSATTVPLVEGFESDATTDTVPAFANDDTPIQIPLTPGNQYFFRVSGEATGTAAITLEIRSQPNATPSAGLILVPDPSDNASFPAVGLTFAADGVTLATLIGPADHFDTLDSGLICAAILDVDTSECNTIRLYSSDPLGQVVTEIANPLAPRALDVRQDHAGSFFIAGENAGGTDIVVYKLFPDGTFAPTTATIPLTPGPLIGGFTVNVGGTIAYYATFAADEAVKRWNLVTDATMSNLAAGIAGYKIVHMNTLADDSVLVTYKKTSDESIRIIRYTAAGATGATFNAPAGHTLIGSTTPNSNDPTEVIVRTETGPLTGSTFWRLLASNLSTLDSFSVDNFDEGVGQNDTAQFFGPSEADDILVLRQAQTPATPETVTYPIVTEIICPHISETGQLIRHISAEIWTQPGVGTGQPNQGETPSIVLSWSNDGGFTWSTPRTMTMGKQGAYLNRARAFGLGSARDRLYKVTTSDPGVADVIVDFYLNLQEGRH